MIALASPPEVSIVYWGRRGGGSAYARDVARVCADAFGPSRCSLLLRRGVEDRPAFERLGMPIDTVRLPIDHGSAGGWLTGFGDVVKFALRLSGRAPRLVIFPMNFPFAWPLIKAYQRAGSSVFYVAHDASPHPGDFASLWQRFTQARLVAQADHVVTLSSFVRDRLLERLGPDSESRFSIAPFETVSRLLATRARSRPLPGTPLRMLFLGRLLAYKGLSVLAQALAHLPLSPEWRLTIAGAGRLEDEARRLFAGQERVRLRLEWLPEAMFGDILDGHDVLLAPYTEASQSGVVAEALRRGIPAIVTPVGALAEQVGFGRAGLVAAQPNARSFAEAILALLSDRGRLSALSFGAIEYYQERALATPWPTLLRRSEDGGASGDWTESGGSST